MTPEEHRRELRKTALKRNLIAHLFLAPYMVVFVIFMAIPLGATVYLSFLKGGVLGGMEYVGFDNYVSLSGNRKFNQSIWFTLTYVSIIIPVVLALSLFLAILLTDKFIKGKGFFKVALFFPNLAPMVTLSVLWTFMIHPEIGLFNLVIEKLNGTPPNWLGTEATAMLTIMLLELWRGVGFYLVTFIAGLVAIPSDLYEAAEIDGANGWQQFWNITLPSLRPTILFTVIMATIFNFQVFDSIFVLTGGGPGGSTSSVAHYIFTNAFRFDRLGRASTMATLLMVAIFIVTMLEFRLLRSDD